MTPPQNESLPNFLIVGAPKSGTTSLYHYLAQHPDIYMSPIKEPSYFMDEVRPENFSPEAQDRVRRGMQSVRQYLSGNMQERRFGGPVTSWEDYLKLFREVSGQKAIGEASVAYLWSESAPRNIAAAIPQAKIVMMLRNPVERAWSQYRQAITMGLVQHSFREHIRRNREHEGGCLCIYNPFLELGLYGEQVQRYAALFPADRIRVYWYEDYRDSATKVFRDLLRFLEVDENFQPDVSRRYLEAPPPDGACALESADRRYLQDYYREDVLKLAEYVHRDLSGWLEAERL